ncbi:hypothetical protein ACLK19_18215 [Escherichia coli]
MLDALTEHHLEIQGEALRDAPLVTGGSGLAIRRARQWAQKTVTRLAKQGIRSLGAASCYPFMLSNDQPPGGTLPSIPPAREVEIWHAASQPKLCAGSAHELAEWVLGQESVLAPLVLPPPALTW